MSLRPASAPFRANQLRPANRSRMRGGRLTDLDCKPLADCTIYDLMDGGVGLLVDPQVVLPTRLLLHDDLEHTVAECRIQWRQDRQLAIALEAMPISASLFEVEARPSRQGD